MDKTAKCVGAMTLASLLWLCCIATASAAVGDVDVRFGTHGQFEVDDTYNSVVLEQPDGQWLVIGQPISAADGAFNQLSISRHRSNGQLDKSFGLAGRIVVPMPAGPAEGDAQLGAAAQQSDGKILVAGAGGVSSNQWGRYVARLDSSGSLDPTFGVGGVVDGGYAGNGFDGWGSGYSKLLVLPNGDILAVIDDHGTRFIDRFNDSGLRVASSAIDSAPVAMAPQGLDDAILLTRQPGSASVKRLRRDGSVDPNFGQGGQAVLSSMDPTSVTVAAADARMIVCGSTGIQRLTADGRTDASFGTGGNGLVKFDGQSAPTASRCDGLALDPDGSILAIASDVQGTAAVSHRTYVIGRTADGAADPRFGAGTGFVTLHGFMPPGMQWRGDALRWTQDRNATMVWHVTSFDRARMVVESIDLGRGTARSAVGLPYWGLRISEQAGTHELRVVRNGSPAGAASVRFETIAGTTTDGDFATTSGQLHWADGDDGAKTIRVTITDDSASEGEETFHLRLFDVTGVDTAAETSTITIVDDDALRGLRFSDRNITWISGPNIPYSSWAKWKLHLDDALAGPITAYYYFTNGIDSCCVRQLRWAAGESGAQSIAPFAGDSLGSQYSVVLVDEWWNATGPDATVKVVIDPTPTGAPSGAGSGAGSGSSSGGKSSGGGAFDAPVALVLLFAAVLATNGRRRITFVVKADCDRVSSCGNESRT